MSWQMVAMLEGRWLKLYRELMVNMHLSARWTRLMRDPTGDDS